MNKAKWVELGEQSVELSKKYIYFTYREVLDAAIADKPDFQTEFAADGMAEMTWFSQGFESAGGPETLGNMQQFRDGAQPGTPKQTEDEYIETNPSDIDIYNTASAREMRAFEQQYGTGPSTLEIYEFIVKMDGERTSRGYFPVSASYKAELLAEAVERCLSVISQGEGAFEGTTPVQAAALGKLAFERFIAAEIE